MHDGSDAIADWPLLNALVNTAHGATWVSIHHGGGVGIGQSIHAGQVSRRRRHPDRRREDRAGADQRPGHGRHPPRRRWIRARGRASPGARRARADGGRIVTATFRALWDEMGGEPCPATAAARVRCAWTTAGAGASRVVRGPRRRRSGRSFDDGNGNLFASWGRPGGAGRRHGRRSRSTPCRRRWLDGPPGEIVGAFLALDALREHQRSPPARPIVVVARSPRRRALVRPVLPRLPAPDRRGGRRTAAAELRDRDGVALAPRARSRARPAVAPTCSAGSACSSSCTSSGARAGGRAPGRHGQRDLAAGPLADGLRRQGRPRRDHAHRGPPRSDADVRLRGAGRQDGGEAGGERTPPSVGSSVAPNATNAVPSRVTGVARRARRPTPRPWTGSSPASCTGPPPGRAGRDDGRVRREVGHRRGPSTRRSRPGSRPSSATLRCPAAPATTPACWWGAGCPPRCCSCATRPASRTRQPSTPPTTIARPGSPRSRACPGSWRMRWRRRVGLDRRRAVAAATCSSRPRATVRFTAVTPGRRRAGGRRTAAGVTLPGLANAHSHAFHRALRGRTHDRGGSFTATSPPRSRPSSRRCGTAPSWPPSSA